MIKELLVEANIITAKNKINPKFYSMLGKHPNIKILLMEHFNGQDTAKDLKIIIRMIIDGHEHRGECKLCGNETKYDFYQKCFKTYCSHTCSWNDPEKIIKIKQTKKIKYGSEKYNNSKKAKITKINKRKQREASR